jgi:hypothetical protein
MLGADDYNQRRLPVELTEYVVSNSLQNDPAFLWWVSDVLKQREREIDIQRKATLHKKISCLNLLLKPYSLTVRSM